MFPTARLVETSHRYYEYYSMSFQYVRSPLLLKRYASTFLQILDAIEVLSPTISFNYINKF